MFFFIALLPKEVANTAKYHWSRNHVTTVYEYMYPKMFFLVCIVKMLLYQIVNYLKKSLKLSYKNWQCHNHRVTYIFILSRRDLKNNFIKNKIFNLNRTGSISLEVFYFFKRPFFMDKFYICMNEKSHPFLIIKVLKGILFKKLRFK